MMVAYIKMKWTERDVLLLLTHFSLKPFQNYTSGCDSLFILPALFTVRRAAERSTFSRRATQGASMRLCLGRRLWYPVALARRQGDNVPITRLRERPKPLLRLM